MHRLVLHIKQVCVLNQGSWFVSTVIKQDIYIFVHLNLLSANLVETFGICCLRFCDQNWGVWWGTNGEGLKPPTLVWYLEVGSWGMSNKWFPHHSSVFKHFDSSCLPLLIGHKRTLFHFFILFEDLFFIFCKVSDTSFIMKSLEKLLLIDWSSYRWNWFFAILNKLFKFRSRFDLVEAVNIDPTVLRFPCSYGSSSCSFRLFSQMLC